MDEMMKSECSDWPFFFLDMDMDLSEAEENRKDLKPRPQKLKEICTVCSLNNNFEEKRRPNNNNNNWSKGVGFRFSELSLGVKSVDNQKMA